jgi:hypothetical protein
MTTSATGERRQVTVNGALPACGAAAAPRADGDLWVIDGDNGVHIVDATGAVRASASLGIGARGDLAVTPKDGLVAIVGTNIHYVRDEAADLGPAVALGRRGSEVLVLDATGVISVVEDATLVPQRTVAGRDDVRSFALLDDDTAVLLLDGGEDIVVFDGAGVTRTIGTGVVGASHIAALPGGTLVIAGHAGDGVQVLSLVE